MWQVLVCNTGRISCPFHLQRRSRLFSPSQESSSSGHTSICFDRTATTSHVQVISTTWQPRQRQRQHVQYKSKDPSLQFTRSSWTKLQAKPLPASNKITHAAQEPIRYKYLRSTTQRHRASHRQEQDPRCKKQVIDQSLLIDRAN